MARLLGNTQRHVNWALWVSLLFALAVLVGAVAWILARMIVLVP